MWRLCDRRHGSAVTAAASGPDRPVRRLLSRGMTSAPAAPPEGVEQVAACRVSGSRQRRRGRRCRRRLAGGIVGGGRGAGAFLTLAQAEHAHGDDRALRRSGGRRAPNLIMRPICIEN
jgi:hypothetical protein